jgi:hypothetical protein
MIMIYDVVRCSCATIYSYILHARKMNGQLSAEKESERKIPLYQHHHHHDIFILPYLPCTTK